ncbi:MAG: hypothetical protein WBL20_08820 [Sphingobium sp.]
MIKTMLSAALLAALSLAAPVLAADASGAPQGHQEWCSVPQYGPFRRDVLIVMASLTQEPTVYPDAWGYRDAMAALVEQGRPA